MSSSQLTFIFFRGVETTNQSMKGFVGKSMRHWAAKKHHLRSEAGVQGCHCLIVAGAAAVCQSLQGNAAGAFRGMDGVDLRTSEKGNRHVVSSHMFNNQSSNHLKLKC
jgi:hypothetical protein